MFKLTMAFLMIGASTASAEPGRGFFSESGEMVYVFKRGIRVETADGKPVPNGPHHSLQFQEDELVRCYFNWSGNVMTNLNCVLLKPVTP